MGRMEWEGWETGLMGLDHPCLVSVTTGLC